MAKSVVIHIGTTKTGSTSIQHSLSRARRSGDLGPVCYPLWKNDNHQQRLAVLYLPLEELDLFPSLRERYPAAERDFRKMRRKYREFLFRELRSADKAIISAEVLSHLFTPERATALRDDLADAGFREFRILLYVRDPADYYLSSMNQSLRMSDDLPLIKDPATFRYDFLRIAQSWEDVFPGDVFVRKYDRNLDVVDDFSGLLESSLGVSFPRRPLRKNYTLSSEGMQILQDYRETFSPGNGGYLTPDARRLATFLEQSQLACDLPQTLPVLKSPVAEKIRANHQADADVLRSQYGVDLGLRRCSETSAVPHRATYRVDDIVQSVDPAVIHQLLLRYSRKMADLPSGKRSLPLRVASRMYRRIPTPLRPVRLVTGVK